MRLPAPPGQLSPSCHSLRLGGDLEQKPTLRRVASRGMATCSCLLELRASSEWDVSSLDTKALDALWPQHHFGDLLCASQCHPLPDGTSLHEGPGQGRGRSAVTLPFVTEVIRSPPAPPAGLQGCCWDLAVLPPQPSPEPAS